MHSKRKASDDNEIVLPAKFSRIDEVLSRGNNSLMQLNEIGIKGLKWSIEQINNVHPQRFKASCVFSEPFSGCYEVIPSGFSFYCEGLSKAFCKHDIANQIMDRLSGKYLPPEATIITPKIINTSPVKDLSKVSQKNINGEVVTQDSAVRILNEKTQDIEYIFTLNENGYCCHVSFRGFVFKGSGTNKKSAKRDVASKILQKCYKISVADESKYSQQPILPTALPSTPIVPPVPDADRIPKNRQKNFSNLIQSMVKNGYEGIASTLEVQYSKRKVLSGLVISRQLKAVYPSYIQSAGTADTQQQRRSRSLSNPIDPILFHTRTGWQLNPDDPGEILKLITISSGTKCLSGNEINENGLVVNDSHAEIISKRAFQYFLYQSISRLQEDHKAEFDDELYGCDILQSVDQGDGEQMVYKLKEDVRIHLYISSAPCGDSRIFMPQSLNSSTAAAEDLDEEPPAASLDDGNEDSHPNRKNRGVLRTKIECGEGTIPIKTKFLQTWDGILGGERLLTMSCSDKVCTWNVVGLQGALLSNVLCNPIYLDSITIGSIFHHEHSVRALYDRARGVTEELEWLNGNVIQSEECEQGELQIILDTSDCFQVNNPFILTVSNQDDRCPGKASNFSINWILGEESYEIISTSKGVTLQNAPSRLCKHNLFTKFLSIFNWLPLLNSSDNNYYQYNVMKSLSNVPDYALGAVNYQKKKICLFKYFDKQNFGLWIGKPIEQDWFSVRYPAGATIGTVTAGAVTTGAAAVPDEEN